ncbi:hypothetical protein BHM03_00060348 [Ensete ventricosum]|nr:hypothetical protein BHM03_00060348 [Ensete ventricosum]
MSGPLTLSPGEHLYRGMLEACLYSSRKREGAPFALHSPGKVTRISSTDESALLVHYRGCRLTQASLPS